MNPAGFVLDRRLVAISQIAVQPVDELTGLVVRVLDTMPRNQRGGRTGPAVRVALEVRRDVAWVPVERAPIVTPSGIVAYPTLEYHDDPIGQPAQLYRVRLASDLYVPRYRARPNQLIADPAPQLTGEGVVVRVRPFGANQEPWRNRAEQPKLMRVMLAPSPSYAFSGDVRVLRGRVVEPDGRRPVPDVEVTYRSLETVVTDARGEFALPLRFAPARGAIQVDALDRRFAERPGAPPQPPTRAKTARFTLPGALASGVQIQFDP